MSEFGEDNGSSTEAPDVSAISRVRLDYRRDRRPEPVETVGWEFGELAGTVYRYEDGRVVVLVVGPSQEPYFYGAPERVIEEIAEHRSRLLHSIDQTVDKIKELTACA